MGCWVLVIMMLAQLAHGVDPAEKPLGTPLGQTLTVTSNSTQTVFRRQLGTNMVVQGGFATNLWTGFDGDSHLYWTTNDVWSIDGSVSNAHCGTVATDGLLFLSQDLATLVPRPTVMPGDRCRLIYTVSDWATGTVVAALGGVQGTVATTNGTFTNWIEFGSVDKTVSFAPRQGTNNEFRIDSVSLVAFDSLYGEGISIYNAGANDVYMLPNSTTSQFDQAYANGEYITVKAGMIETLPVSTTKEGKYLSITYRCADGVTSTIVVTVD
jgi:hypothetical protein